MTKNAHLINFLGLYPKGLPRIHKKMSTKHGVKVSPRLAAQWMLKLFKGQRGVSPTHVKVLASEMKAGVWMDTGNQGIAFDWYGRLVDGQHRLLAVIESGVTIETSVVRGVDPKAYLHMDENTKVRSAGAYLVGFKKPKVCVSAYRLFLDYELLQERAQKGEGGKGFLAFGRRSGTAWKADREHVLSWCIQRQSELEHTVTRVTSKEARLVMPPTSVAAGFYLWIYLQAPDEADRFFTKLIDGVEFEGRTDPVYQLRSQLLHLKNASKGSMGTGVPYFQYGALLIKAWNAYLKREELKKIEFKQKEGWPLLTTRTIRKRATRKVS